MLKYFSKKLIRATYEYNNSLGWHQIRSFTGIYFKFEIEEESYPENCYHYFKIRLFGLLGGCVFEEGVHGFAEFYGLGQIKEVNNGPYNYLNFKRLF
jgi:hypothetical protein